MTTRFRGFRRYVAGVAWLVLGLPAAGCDPIAEREPEPPQAHPPRGTAVPFTRIPARQLSVVTPGVMMIRTGEEWRALWKRYATTPVTAPAVDFSREMVAVLSMGGYGSCTNEGRFVQRVERTADSLFVVVLHDPSGMTCDMYVEPVDLVRLPRSDLPVRFVPHRPGVLVPGPARWLDAEQAVGGGT